jgi:hypothetical protein
MTSIIGDPLITCVVNARVAMESRRPDIGRIWETCERLARETYQADNGFRCSLTNCSLGHNSFEPWKTHLFFDKKWKKHPSSRKLLNQIILRLIQGSFNDFQTAAMLICAFTPNIKSERKSR